MRRTKSVAFIAAIMLVVGSFFTFQQSTQAAETVTYTGTLTAFYQANVTQSEHTTVYSLRIPDETVEPVGYTSVMLDVEQVTEGDLVDLVGQEVSVTGIYEQDALRATNVATTPGTQEITPNIPTTGQLRYLMLQCYFPGDDTGTSDTSKGSTYFNGLMNVMEDYFLETSYGQFDLRAKNSEARGWFRMPYSHSTYVSSNGIVDYDMILAHCVGAAFNGGVDYRKYDGTFLMLDELLLPDPDDTIATTGYTDSDFKPTAWLSPRIWNDAAWVAHFMQKTIGPSSGCRNDCQNIPVGDFVNYNVDFYDNPWDVMSGADLSNNDSGTYGNIPVFTNNMYKYLYLDWIEPGQEFIYPGVGNFELVLDFATRSTGTNLLLVLLGNEAIEARTPEGFDTGIPGEGVFVYTPAGEVNTRGTGFGLLGVDPQNVNSARLTTGDIVQLPSSYFLSVLGRTANGFQIEVGTEPAEICRTLTYNASPDTLGNVTASPAPNCSDGQRYLINTNVQLTANPVAGAEFVDWTGDVNSTANPLNITLNNNTTVTANFAEVCYTLATNNSPSDGGSINRSPQPNCGGGAGYSVGTNVTITANPNPGFDFIGWSGDAFGANTQTTVTMNGNRSVTASYAEVCYTLTTSVNPGGSGTVGVTSPTCSDGVRYRRDVSITLTGQPNAGFAFDNWTGDVTGTQNPISTTIVADTSVTANFVTTDEMLYNGSMDFDVDTNGVPDGWDQFGTESSFTSDEGMFCNDNYAYNGDCLFLFRGDDPGIFGVTQDIWPADFGLSNGSSETVKFSFMVAGRQLPENTGFIGMRLILKNTDTQAKDKVLCDIGIRGTFGWTEITCSITPTITYNKINVAFGMKDITEGMLGFDLGSVKIETND